MCAPLQYICFHGQEEVYNLLETSWEYSLKFFFFKLLTMKGLVSLNPNHTLLEKTEKYHLLIIEQIFPTDMADWKVIFEILNRVIS